MSAPADAAVRAEALDPGRSFLVQAPAGSGKTELLIQRYLRLLSLCKAPEEVLAITFTRKAAAEMRSRVLEALLAADAAQPPEAEHLRRGYELAEAVLRQDAAQDWGLLQQPARLRIGTIDAINASLAARTPFSSGSSALREVSEDARPLYEEAARDTVALVAEAGPLGVAMTRLLEHFDNRAESLMSLLAAMLARRDQWLRHTGAGVDGEMPGLRAALEQSLASLVNQELAVVDGLLSADLRSRLLPLLQYAGQSLQIRDPLPDVTAWSQQQDFPPASAEWLTCWRGLAQSLLTDRGEWRKTVNKNQGFGTEQRDIKNSCLELLQELVDETRLCAALAGVKKLPQPQYSDAQWSVLQALLTVLPISAALLQQVFARRARVDFNQVAGDALTALGRADAPSELSLVLDYRLQHILMDEFQDTSRSQYELLRQLTAGWQAGDARSLFLVGDPMQSIYRFREADVAVFLGIQQQGLGDLPIEFLQLESNFRADPQLVDWVNRCFASILPEQANAALAAVPFWPSRAERDASEEAGLSWVATPAGDRAAEASELVALVADCTRRYPQDSIGILVRSRAHARLLAPRLRAAGVEFAAPDLEVMTEEPAVQDLLALTRALLHPADRIAWLAILRAPWCGLTLADLHSLAVLDLKAGIWDLLESDAQLDGLSSDGAARARGLRESLRPWLARRGACSLRELVEGCWLWLGGPATLEDAACLDITQAYFEFLASQEQGSDWPDLARLHEQLGEQAVARGSADARVQVLTMHKAKGLEFDSVFLPGLAYGTRKDTRPPLLWRELAELDAPLVLAPINATGEQPDEIFEWLWRQEQQRARYERDRLLYVAVTRARRRLWLFAARPANNDSDWQPRPDTLLAPLWPVCRNEIPLPSDASAESEPALSPRWTSPALRRLVAGWTLPDSVRAHPPLWSTAPEDADALEFDWAQRWTRQVGVVVHRWLEDIVTQGGLQPERHDFARQRAAIARQLQHLGVGTAQLERATRRVIESLQACVEDPDGRWVLSAEHQEQAAELAVSKAETSGFKTLRVDRSFVTADGERWIIDYKTGRHEGKDIEVFLASESTRYRAQLREYRDALAGMDPRPIRTALYFPLLQRLHEVDVDLADADSE